MTDRRSRRRRGDPRDSLIGHPDERRAPVRHRVRRTPGRELDMAITEAARNNHDELFPGHVSTLKDTDPELIEVFDNFAFDEVLQYGDLNTVRV